MVGIRFLYAEFQFQGMDEWGGVNTKSIAQKNALWLFTFNMDHRKSHQWHLLSGHYQLGFLGNRHKKDSGSFSHKGTVGTWYGCHSARDRLREERNQGESEPPGSRGHRTLLSFGWIHSSHICPSPASLWPRLRERKRIWLAQLGSHSHTGGGTRGSPTRPPMMGGEQFSKRKESCCPQEKEKAITCKTLTKICLTAHPPVWLSSPCLEGCQFLWNYVSVEKKLSKLLHDAMKNFIHEFLLQVCAENQLHS